VAEGLEAAEVEEIVVGFAEPSLHHVGQIGAYPQDMTGAQFSARFSLAMTLLLGGNDLDHYRALEVSGHHLPEVSALAERIRLEVDPAADAAFPDRIFTTVTVHRTDGTTMRATAGSKGTAEDPLSKAEVVEKFRRLAATAVSDSEVARIEAAVLALAEDGPVSAVLAAG
jgi:2-methylcitrate dehydratase PrpD